MEATAAVDSIRTCCQDLATAKRELPHLLETLVYELEDHSKVVTVRDFVRSVPGFATPFYTEAVQHDPSGALLLLLHEELPISSKLLADGLLRCISFLASPPLLAALFSIHPDIFVVTFGHGRTLLSKFCFDRTPTPSQALSRLEYAMQVSDVPYESLVPRVYRCDMAMVTLLQRRGVRLDRRHLLQQASACANFELVLDLLAAGDDPNDLGDDPDNPWYPLHAICTEFSLAMPVAVTIMALLAGGADRTRKNKDGHTAVEIMFDSQPTWLGDFLSRWDPMQGFASVQNIPEAKEVHAWLAQKRPLILSALTDDVKQA